MKFLRLLLAEAGQNRWRLMASVFLSGSAMALMMSIVNTVADGKPHEGINFFTFFLFVICALTVVTMQSYSLNLTSVLSERIVERLRVRFASLVRRGELDGLEAIGPVKVYDTVVRETTIISESAGMIIYALSSVIALMLASVYIALLSFLSFVVVCSLLFAWVYFFRLSQRNSREVMVQAHAAESRFFALLAHLLYGFKEVKLHTPRGDDLERVYLGEASRSAETSKVLAARQLNGGLKVSFSIFYLLLGTAVFALPQYLDDTQAAMKVVYVVIFMFTTVDSINRAYPLLAKVNLALDRIDDLEKQLVMAAAADPDPATLPSHFTSVALHGVTYVHSVAGEQTFSLGPCDLELRPGELIFLVGGNGSGKSTLTRVLTGLYKPSSGSITWDGQLVTELNASRYRNLFSAVYSDFHLFDRVYGMGDIPPERVSDLLTHVGLDQKTKFENSRFTFTELSTGQRKRLALVVALIEDRPIYVLDELSADQDPGFRKRFYEEFLPALKAKGKTLIVVSHDDRYFGSADRILHMEDGRLYERATS